MRILLYNWVDNADAAGRGGGVRTYQANILRALEAEDDVTVVALSSGVAERITGGPVRWARVRRGGAGRRFELINARPFAPSHKSFGLAEQLSHPPTEAAFAAFLDAEGPFDVVHFNNLEGLPAAVLAERARRPKTRFILSLHNYYPFCPQVNLWRQEAAHCADFESGRACVDCLPFQHDGRSVRLAHAADSTLERAGLLPGSPLRKRLVTPAIKVGGRLARLARRPRRGPRPAAPQPTAPHPQSDAAQAFAHRRRTMTDLISGHCDAIHCVSDRVRDIALAHGLPRERLHVAYIGSDHADRFAQTQPKASLTRADGTLTLAFLGYMRRDKGAMFLLDALAALPDATARRLRVLIAAAGVTPESAAQIEALRPRLADLMVQNGYARAEMDSLLAQVDLGVVPVLWEDALPQVAIEMHARHIPLLTSDRGGARELGRCAALVFRAGDTASFADRLTAALDGQIDLTAYWRGARAPTDLATHVAALRRLYDAPA